MGGGIGHTRSTQYHPEHPLRPETSDSSSLDGWTMDTLDIPQPQGPELLLERFTADEDDEMIVEEENGRTMTKKMKRRLMRRTSLLMK